MKTMKTIIFLFLVTGIFQVNLFSLITSRVEGHVIDKETGQPLKNAGVRLVLYNGYEKANYPTAKTKTNESGFFVFHVRQQGYFFVECFKKGYAVFCPYYIANVPNPKEHLHIFSLKKGQVKKLRIGLEKGGSLRIEIKKKDSNGISGFADMRISINRNLKGLGGQITDYSQLVAYLRTNERGLGFLDGLHPGVIYNIFYLEDGLPHVDQDILIKKSVTSGFSRLYDFTDKTGISGKIVFSNASIIHSTIVLRDSKNKIISDSDTTNKSQYLFRHIEPGEYLLIAYAVYENSKIKRKTPVSVKKNVTAIVDFNL
ncbi:MAG: carboxypeptidase regulatory-like domain-containing protein [bacterium]|nr:carboxypeptidase regulatory-like domain-containing protein [bacterium]